jgi:hypothetical protein
VARAQKSPLRVTEQEIIVTFPPRRRDRLKNKTAPESIHPVYGIVGQHRERLPTSSSW